MSAATTSGFETYTADADLSPLFKGLPGDRCQCPHWGVVVKGKLEYRGVDGDMVAAAIGIQVGEQPSMARLRSRREQQAAQADEKQRPDDVGSRAHACEGGYPAV